MKYILGLLSLLLILSCSTDDGVLEVPVNEVVVEPIIQPIINPSGSYTLRHDGEFREYHYYQPAELEDNAPLVFVLHGYNANALDFMDWISMEELADEQGFAVVYPQGLNDDTRRTHWNAALNISNEDDVGFLSNLALHLQQTYDLNPEQTFISGYSNGGFMSYEMILKRPDIFKAAASISVTMSLSTWENRSDAIPVPVLQLSGALDRIVPVHGLVKDIGGWGGAPEMAEIVGFWGDLIQAEVPAVETLDETIITTYINPETGNEVWYYLLQDLEHNIPLGDDYNVDTPSLIWEFFSRF